MKRKSALQRYHDFIEKNAYENLTELQKDKIYNFFVKYLADHPGEFILNLGFLHKFIKYDTAEDYHCRWTRLQQNTIHTLNYYIILYGEDKGPKFYNNSKRRKPNSPSKKVEKLLKRKSFKDIKTFISESQKSELEDLFKDYPKAFDTDHQSLLEDIINSPNDKNIKARWLTAKNNYRKDMESYSLARYNLPYKQSPTYQSWRKSCKNKFASCIEYWLKLGHSYEEARTLQSLEQARRGTFNKGRISLRSYDYWSKLGFCEDEQKQIITAIQSRDKAYFIKKYGLEDGLEAYNNMIQERKTTWYSRPEYERRSINLSRGRTYEELKHIHGEDEALAIMRKRIPASYTVSLESMEFFKTLDSLDQSLEKYSVTGYKSNEFFIGAGNNFFSVDYFFNGKIIEYHGSFWHGDPRLFENESTIHPVSKKYIKDIWAADLNRRNILSNLGYDVKIVWSEDVKQNIDKCLTECLNFLKETDNENTSLYKPAI